MSFLSIIDLGETAEDDQPAFTHNGDLIPLPGERILLVASFPSIGLIHSRSDDGWYKMDKETFPGEGGETIVTDQRLVVAQQKYDVGKHGKRGYFLFPFIGGAVRALSRSRAKRRRKRTILAGQINLSDIRLLTYRSEKPALGPEFHWLQFVAPSDSVFVGIELHSKAIADNRGAGIAAAVAAAHGLGSANADRRTPNTITWEFQGPGVGAPAPAEQKVAGTTSSPVVTTVAESRACPWCAHLVDSASIVCAYCERSIEAETKPPSRSATVPTGHVGGTTERYRSCPWCAETISAGALECPICEKNLRPAPGLASATEPRTDSVSEVREPQVPRDETGPIGAAPPVTRTEAPLNRDGSLGANDDRNRAHETAGGASATIQTRKWQLVAAVAVVAALVVLGASFFRTPDNPPPTTTLATAQDTGTSTTQSTSTTEETTTTQIATGSKLPDQFLGTWSGLVTLRLDGKATAAQYKVELTATQDGITLQVDLPKKCVATLTVLSAAPADVKLSGHYDTGDCLQGGTWTLHYISPGTLHYTWTLRIRNRFDEGDIHI